MNSPSSESMYVLESLLFKKGPLESNDGNATRGPHRLVRRRCSSALGILQQFLDVGYTDVVPLGKNPLVPSGD